MSSPLIEVICVTYKQSGPLTTFVQSFLNQTAPNWKLSIYHDGYDHDFEYMMRQYVEIDPRRITYHWSEVRHNDWGHSLRAQALPHVTGDYVLITNGDNYYVPIYIDAISKAIAQSNPDVVMYDMIHSHDHSGYRNLPPYSYFKTDYSRNNIDMGAAVIRADLAKQAGFRDRSFAADATYFEDIARLKDNKLTIKKLNQVLFVHN